MNPQKEVKEEIDCALSMLKEALKGLKLYEVNDGYTSVVWAENAKRAIEIAAKHTHCGDDMGVEVTTERLSLEEVLERIPNPPEHGNHPAARLAAWLMDTGDENEGLLWSEVYA